MKIGIIFSGVIRDFDTELFKTRVIQNNPDIVAVIASCNYLCHDNVEYITQYVEECKTPDHWQFVSRRCNWNNYNTVSMHYHNKRAFDILTQIVPDVDIVIKYRSDVQTTNNFPIPEASTIEPNTIYVPEINHYNGINDQIAYGDRESMRQYCSLYDHIEKYVTEQRITFHPETLLCHHLKQLNIPVKTFRFHYNLNPKRTLNFTPGT